MTGFKLMYKGMDILIVTEAKRKTRQWARKVCAKLGVPDCPGNIGAVLYYATPAEGEYREINGRWDLEIRTENSGGGGGWVDEYREKGIKEVIYV